MPTSLSLQDLQRARRSHVSRICDGQQQQKYLHQQQQFVDIEVVEEEHLAVVEDLVAQDDEDFVSDGIVNIEDPSGLDVESEQIVVDETLDDQQIQQAISSQSNDDRNTIQMWNNQQNTDIIKFEQPGQTNMEPDNTKREEEMFLDDTPLFPHSQIGVHKFSTEFLAIAQKHRLEPKVRAILLDLLQRSMPEENQCPQTIADMHKLVAQEEVDSSSFPSGSKALFPATSNQQMTHQHNKFITSPLNARRSNQIIGEAGFAMEEEAAYSDEGDDVVYDPAMINYRNVGPSTDLCLLVPRLFETINYLQEEVAFLRSELKAYASPSNNTTSYGTVRQVKRRISNLDGRFGLHIYDEHGVFDSASNSIRSCH